MAMAQQESRRSPRSWSRASSVSIMFQGIQAVALPIVQEFGYTKEIEDRVLAPLPVSLVAIEKVLFGAIQGLLRRRSYSRSRLSSTRLGCTSTSKCTGSS